MIRMLISIKIMAKLVGTKRVRFVESRSSAKREPQPYLHCAEEACSEVKRYKLQKAHQDKYHDGEYAESNHCTEVNCVYCIYRNSSASHHLPDPKKHILTKTFPIP